MNRNEVIDTLNKINVTAKADRWTNDLIEMPNGIFYSAADFKVVDAYWNADRRIESPALVYSGEAEFNAVIFPLTQ